MIVSLKLDLSEQQLDSLGLHLHGKKRRATRKDVVAWAQSLIAKKLVLPGKEESSELRNYVCPKCQKPIALSVPMNGNSAKVAAARAKAKEATDALVQALRELEKAL